MRNWRKLISVLTAQVAILSLATLPLDSSAASAEVIQRRFWRSPTDLISEPKPMQLKPSKLSIASFPAYRIPAGTPDDPVAVYLMAGQSNMVGAARLENARPAEIAPFEAVQIWSDRLGFVPLAPGFNGPYRNMGPEYSFGRRMVERRREQIYIIKVGLGATTLAEDWHPAGVNNWHDRLTETVAIALSELNAQGIAYEIEGFVWMQGESDVWNAVFAAKYEQNLTLLIADLQRRYGETLAIAIGLIRGDLPVDESASLSAVRVAQRAVAQRNDRVFLVDTDTLGEGKDLLQADLVHYDAIGQTLLGETFGNKF